VTRKPSEHLILVAELARERALELYRAGGVEEARANRMALEKALWLEAITLERLRQAGRFVPGRSKPWPDEPPAAPNSSEDGGAA